MSWKVKKSSYLCVPQAKNEGVVLKKLVKDREGFRVVKKIILKQILRNEKFPLPLHSLCEKGVTKSSSLSNGKGARFKAGRVVQGHSIYRYQPLLISSLKDWEKAKKQQHEPMKFGSAGKSAKHNN